MWPIKTIQACRTRRNIPACRKCCRFWDCVSVGKIDVLGNAQNEGKKKKGGEKMKLEPRNQEIVEFVNSLYCPKRYQDEKDALIEFVKSEKLRAINKDDSRKNRLTCLEIITKGNGTRSTFFEWGVKWLDLNHVSDIYAEIYIYNDDGRGYPSKIRVDNPRVTIIESK